jgi:hypothetical protein
VHAAVFLDFELTAEELAAIDELDAGKRGGPEPDAITLESLGLEINRRLIGCGWSAECGAAGVRADGPRTILLMAILLHWKAYRPCSPR